MANPNTPVRVLIVEDNDADVFLVEEALRSQGLMAQIERCQDGEEALVALGSVDEMRMPDIIIVDLNIPKVNGLEILKYARSLKQLDSIPVLVLTSSQSRLDRTRSLQLGARAFISKPPTLPEFLSMVGSGIRGLIEKGADAGARQLRSTHVHRRIRAQFRRSRAIVLSRGNRCARFRTGIPAL